MSLAENYQSIINLYRLNITLTNDAIRMLDSIVTTFNNTYIQVSSISELEAKIRRIFLPEIADRLIKQLYGVSRGFLSHELDEAKKNTIYYALTLILSALKGKGVLDGYDIAMTILNNPNLQAFKPALPQFPYTGGSMATGAVVNNVNVLPGFFKGADDYIAALGKSLINATPLQLNQFGAQFGIQNASVDFNGKFRTMLLQRGLALNKPEIGFMDLIDILLTFK